MACQEKILQTTNFSAVKTKLQRLLERHKVRLVYPIAKQKWIIHKSATSEDTFGRRMHNGLVALGIVLLLGGLGASFYYVPHPILGDIVAARTYPYQTLGAALIIAGALSIALGVYYSPEKKTSFTSIFCYLIPMGFKKCSSKNNVGICPNTPIVLGIVVFVP